VKHAINLSIQAQMSLITRLFRPGTPGAFRPQTGPAIPDSNWTHWRESESASGCYPALV